MENVSEILSFFFSIKCLICIIITTGKQSTYIQKWMAKQEDTAHKYELTLMEESSFLISCQSLQADELAGSRLALKSSCTVHFNLVKWEVATESKTNLWLLCLMIRDLGEIVKSKF